jgi:hypothetical protein
MRVGQNLNKTKLTLRSCTLRELKASLHLTTFGNTLAMISLLLRASLDGLTLHHGADIFAIQANWLMHSAVAHMTMHNV